MHQMGKFTGYVVLKPGQAEKWALRESTKEGIMATALRNMPLDIVGLNHTSTASQFFDRQKQYDAVQLPFSLSLEFPQNPVQVKEKHRLHISRGEEKSVRTVQPGLHLESLGASIDVLTVNPWSGLVREERGKPGLVMTVGDRQNESSHKLFFEEGFCLRPRDGFSIQWHWVADEEEARLAVEHFDSGKKRWGIREAGRIHWFESLTPGDGLIASDGKEYTLIDLQESDNSAVIGIAVEIKDKNRSQRSVITASEQDSDQEIFFEPGMEENHLLCLSWREGSALCAFFDHGSLMRTEILEEEKSLELTLSDETDILCTLSQVIEKSIPVPTEESPLKELVLQVDEEKIALRSGESRPLKDLRLTYSYSKTIPPARHRLQAVFQDEEKARSFILGGTRKVRIESWKLSLNSDPSDGTLLPVVIRVERMLGTPSQLAGLSICFLGIIGLTIFRFADWRQDRKDDHPYTENKLD
jgi:hypothetical protein